MAMFNAYFSNWEKELYTLPHLTRIRRNPLFPEKFDPKTGQITKEGMDTEKAWNYDTEVMQVYNTISQLPGIVGLAFYSYDQKKANKTFNKIKGEFEKDWLIISPYCIVVIEVGSPKDKNN